MGGAKFRGRQKENERAEDKWIGKWREWRVRNENKKKTWESVLYCASSGVKLNRWMSLQKEEKNNPKTENILKKSRYGFI